MSEKIPNAKTQYEVLVQLSNGMRPDVAVDSIASDRAAIARACAEIADNVVLSKLCTNDFDAGYNNACWNIATEIRVLADRLSHGSGLDERGATAIRSDGGEDAK